MITEHDGIAKCDTIQAGVRRNFAACLYRTWCLTLSNVLKSERAIQMSIWIIEIFVKLRELLLLHKDVSLLVEQVEKKLLKQDDNIELLFSYLSKFLEREHRRPIGFKTKSAE